MSSQRIIYKGRAFDIYSGLNEPPERMYPFETLKVGDGFFVHENEYRAANREARDIEEATAGFTVKQRSAHNGVMFYRHS